MKSARLVAAGYAQHPQSEKHCLRLTVDEPWTTGGARGRWTDIWTDGKAIPPTGKTPIEWGRHHVVYDGQTHSKVEYDSNADGGLH